MRRRLDHGRRRLPKEGAEERGHVLGGGQSAVSAAGGSPGPALPSPQSPRRPPCRRPAPTSVRLPTPPPGCSGRAARPHDPPAPRPCTHTLSRRGWTESRPGPRPQVRPMCTGTQGTLELRLASPGRSGVGWECLPWVTPEPSFAWVGAGNQGGWHALTAHAAVHLAEQPERSASTCPRVTRRTGTVQVGAREPAPGRSVHSPQPRGGDAASCPSQAQPLCTLPWEQAAAAPLGWLPRIPCPPWPRAPGGAPSHSSPWYPPSLGRWHGNRPPGTPRAGTTVSGASWQGGGEKLALGTRAR